MRLDRLAPADADGWCRIVIETPQGGRHKLKHDPSLGAITIDATLPAGMVFPFDFGFLPQTRGEDGDPLDVLVLMDSPGYPGVVVSARLLGVMEADQTDRDGVTVRNDRIIALAKDSTSRGDVQALKDLDPVLLEQIEAFFVQWNRMRGRQFDVRSLRGPQRARNVLRASRAAVRTRPSATRRRCGRNVPARRMPG